MTTSNNNSAQQLLAELIVLSEKRSTAANAALIEVRGNLTRANTRMVIAVPTTLYSMQCIEGAWSVNTGVDAQLFTEYDAKKYSNELRNGNGEHPTAMYPIDYYNAVIDQCKRNIVEYTAMLSRV